MKVVALVQARMGSTRLPNKVMKLIKGVPMIELLLSRLSNNKRYVTYQDGESRKFILLYLKNYLSYKTVN